MDIGRYFPDGHAPQAPADIAVVMPTIVRATTARAIRSVFEQRFAGRIQLMIGVDVARGDIGDLVSVLEDRPAHVSCLLLQLPYSTSVRHGGLHSATDGGSLRAVLSLMANAPLVTYLDDDNQWLPSHLSLLSDAIAGKAWAYAPRLLVSEEDGRHLGRDEWDSVGPGRGRFAASGGFVDPNCLMLDKRATSTVLGCWSETETRQPGVTADRLIFKSIQHLPHGAVAEPKVLYAIRKTNVLHRWIAERDARRSALFNGAETLSA